MTIGTGGVGMSGVVMGVVPPTCGDVAGAGLGLAPPTS